jgi:cob(I)alamin adenosyltransferase
MTKIYTKGGDKGQTGLFSGERVEKYHPLINALGSVDELNSVLGIARGFLSSEIRIGDDLAERRAYAEAALESTKEQTRSTTRDYATLYMSMLHQLDSEERWLESAKQLAGKLHTIQLELFELGAELAFGTPGMGRISDDMVSRFEQWIDELTSGLPELKNFILPTGHPVSAHLHQARTVCRRAERYVVAARDEFEEEGQRRFDDVALRYLNRLADLLFVLAREANKVFGLSDEEWHSLR